MQAAAWPGGEVLAVLATPRKVAIMRELRAGPCSAMALADAVDVSERRVREHLRTMLAHGLVVRIHHPARDHRIAWRLTPAGAQLLALYELIAVCERRLRAAGPPPRRPLVQALRFARARMILLALADAPLGLAELERRLPSIPHTTMEHALGRLLNAGVLSVRPAASGRRYELIERARGGLALIELAGMRWQLLFDAGQPPAGGECLAGVLSLLAPVLRVSAGVQGICAIHMTGGARHAASAAAATARLSVLRGRVAMLPAGAPQPPRARMRASELDLCQALMGGDDSRIELEGDRELARALLAALAAGLRC